MATKKRCSKCRIEKPIDAFYNNRTTTDGLTRWCKECSLKYARSGKRVVTAEQWRQARQRQVAKARWIVAQHLMENCCVDCGETDPIVLEFDHIASRGPKYDNIAKLVQQGKCMRLRAEIPKCDVVCSNCHRRRTASRDAARGRPWFKEWTEFPSGPTSGYYQEEG